LVKRIKIALPGFLAIVLCNCEVKEIYFFYAFEFGQIALPGFEPGSAGPEPTMLDHYTTGLLIEDI
jgi:hypothetical protein